MPATEAVVTSPETSCTAATPGTSRSSGAIARRGHRGDHGRERARPRETMSQLLAAPESRLGDDVSGHSGIERTGLPEGRLVDARSAAPAASSRRSVAPSSTHTSTVRSAIRWRSASDHAAAVDHAGVDLRARCWAAVSGRFGRLSARRPRTVPVRRVGGLPGRRPRCWGRRSGNARCTGASRSVFRAAVTSAR